MNHSKRARKATQALVRENIQFTYYYQRRPYTIVEVSACVDGVDHQAICVAKVGWPDWWQPKRGIEVAKGKCVHRIAQAILNGEQLQDAFAWLNPPRVEDGVVFIEHEDKIKIDEDAADQGAFILSAN